MTFVASWEPLGVYGGFSYEHLVGGFDAEATQDAPGMGEKRESVIKNKVKAIDDLCWLAPN